MGSRSNIDTDNASRRQLYVNTLNLAHDFQEAGLNREQAEFLSLQIAELLSTAKENMTKTFVAKTTLEKAILEHEAHITGFKSEVSKSQELHLASMNRDTERLTSNLDKIRTEIRYEVDKLTASQRLDLNLEKGRIRDELQTLRDRINELDKKLDRECNSLKAAVELTKNETFKYSLGTILAMATACFGVARLLAQ